MEKHEQLRLWLQSQGITQEEAARKMDFTLNYLNIVLAGHRPLTGSVKFAFVETYPETAAILLPEEEE